jgi:putative transcriptional regulator
MNIKLREVLDQQKKSIYWLNKQTGIASSTLSRICNNKTTSIEFSVLDKICEALNCDVSDILENTKNDTTVL